MSPNVFVEIGGEHVPLDQTEWVFSHKCGCPFGCMHADTAEEDTAWLRMFDYAKERNKHKKNGVTAELITKEQFRADVAPKMRLDYKCPHGEDK